MWKAHWRGLTRWQPVGAGWGAAGQAEPTAVASRGRTLLRRGWWERISASRGRSVETTRPGETLSGGCWMRMAGAAAIVARGCFVETPGPGKAWGRERYGGLRRPVDSSRWRTVTPQDQDVIGRARLAPPNVLGGGRVCSGCRCSGSRHEEKQTAHPLGGGVPLANRARGASIILPMPPARGALREAPNRVSHSSLAWRLRDLFLPRWAVAAVRAGFVCVIELSQG